jgi:hypothetical protein
LAYGSPWPMLMVNWHAPELDAGDLKLGKILSRVVILLFCIPSQIQIPNSASFVFVFVLAAAARGSRARGYIAACVGCAFTPLLPLPFFFFEFDVNSFSSSSSSSSNGEGIRW